MMNVASAMHSLNLCIWYSRRERSWYAWMVSLVVSLDFFKDLWIIASIPFKSISSELSLWFSAFKRSMSVWMPEKPLRIGAPWTSFGRRSNTKQPLVWIAHFFATNSISIESNRVRTNCEAFSFTCQLGMPVRQIWQHRALNQRKQQKNNIFSQNKSIFFHFLESQYEADCFVSPNGRHQTETAKRYIHTTNAIHHVTADWAISIAILIGKDSVQIFYLLKNGPFAADAHRDEVEDTVIVCFEPDFVCKKEPLSLCAFINVWESGARRGTRTRLMPHAPALVDINIRIMYNAV